MNSVVASGKVKCDEVSKVALARQLLLSVDEAERLVEKKLQDEQVWALLRQRRYREFQQWLRNRVPNVAVGTLGVPHTAGAGASASDVGGSAASPPLRLPLPRELVGAAVVDGSVDPSVALDLCASTAIAVADSEEARAATARARNAARMRQIRAEGKAAEDAAAPAAVAAAVERRTATAARMRKLRAKKPGKKR